MIFAAQPVAPSVRRYGPVGEPLTLSLPENAPTLPGSSVARILHWCLPAARPELGHRLVHGLNEPASSLHSVVTQLPPTIRKTCRAEPGVRNARTG